MVRGLAKAPKKALQATKDYTRQWNTEDIWKRRKYKMKTDPRKTTTTHLAVEKEMTGSVASSSEITGQNEDAIYTTLRKQRRKISVYFS